MGSGMLEGGGEAAELIRRTDWAATPLGPLDGWSRSLKTIVAIMLHSRHPMFLWWGPDLIQIYNDAYVPSFGLGKHPGAMGQRGRDCWPEIWEIIGPQIDAVMQDGTPSWHEDALVPIYRNGAIEDVYWTYGYSPVYDDDGTIGGTLVVCTETTSRVEAARRAEMANRAKDDFLSTASHELRTPLNAILGWARLLQTGQLDQSAFLRAVDSIDRNARAQVRLIEDILDGSRMITGKLQIDRRPLDLTKVIGAALDAVRPAADARNISLSVRLDPAAARVVGDPERLQQVIWNLANNAIKFTPKGGAVAVSLDRAGTDVQLKVADTGEGIEPEFLPYVFERFRQAEGGTTRRHGGLGLGLALVRHLVEAHGGTVAAESEGPGRGAVFTVTLPVESVIAEATASGAEAEDATMPDEWAFVPRRTTLADVRVLVVDDEADARDLVATALRSRGAEVTTAANAREAIAWAATRSFMVIVSDIGMPDTDGYELLARIRAVTVGRGQHLPAVALTAYSRDEDRRRALAAGFQAYVAKPVEPDDLIEVVANLAATATEPPADAALVTVARAETLAKFERVLNAGGVHEALRFLNNRTAHRYTGLYRFDPPMLRSLFLVDAMDTAARRGDDVLMETTYCSVVGAFERPFTTDDALLDDRLREHPARAAVRSYCGVLLQDSDGRAFGTLCHFDAVPCDVPVPELPLMSAAALLLMRALAAEDRPGRTLA